MGWLLDLLIESIWEKCSQFIVDMMSLITDMFTELLSCDLSLFEELFSIAGDLYSNAIMPLGMAVLLLICVWQLLKSMFGKAGTASEDPVELVFRSGICMFFIVAARPLVDYILDVAGTPYQWIVGTEIKVSGFSEYVSALEAATSVLGIGSLNILILKLVMQFFVAWNYLKMLFVIAERYVLLGVFSYTAPLAFSTGGSKATNNILASWTKMFGGQIVLILLNSWCLKMFLSGYGNLTASSFGFTKFFVATLCLVGFCKITFKLDSYMSSLGVNLGRTSTGMGGMGLLMAAGRIFSHVGKGSGQTADTSPAGKGEEAGAHAGMETDPYAEDAAMAGAAGPIPMGFGMDKMQAEEENGFGSHMDEADAEPEMQAGDFDTMSDMEDGSVLEEIGMMPEDPLSESRDFADTADMDLEPGELSALDGEDLDGGMEEGYMEAAFGSGDSVSAEMGDYPVGQDDLSAGDLKEPDMDLGGTVVGDGSVEDAGLGSGMDAFGRDGSLSRSGGFSGADASAGTQGILGEMGYETGMDGTAGFYSADGSMDSGNVHISGGEKEVSAGGLAGQDFSKIGTGDTQIFPRVGGEEVNGIGYHDFDMPGQTDSAVNTDAGSRYTPADADTGSRHTSVDVNTGAGFRHIPSDANTGTGSQSFPSDANAGTSSQHIQTNANAGTGSQRFPANANAGTSRQNATTNPTASKPMPMDSVPNRQLAAKNQNTDRQPAVKNQNTDRQLAVKNRDTDRKQPQGRPESDVRIQSSETKKQEHRKISEERKLREVPKSRKELKKNRKKNPPQETPDSQG
ncbi:hypothetical protein [Schaedlerella sp.]|uniref:hypothetical protein n=1 Tax=Schaedlerella sp. TaxID=2676057 RepID=UPI003745360B